MYKQVKFTGKFRDLKPMGYEYYNGSYDKSLTEWGDRIWIRRKGRRISFNDYYSLSYLIFEAVILNKRHGKVHYLDDKETNHLFVLDKINYLLLDDDPKLRVNFKDTNEKVQEYYQQYRRIDFHINLIHMMTELFENNMIEVLTVR